MAVTVEEVESWLFRRFIQAPGANLRLEDKKKAIEVAAFVSEIERLAPPGDLTLVDAAAGKGYIGLLAAERLPRARVTFIERNGRVLDQAAAAAREAGIADRCTFVTDDAGTGWPAEPSMALALHACGPAADTILAAAVAARARRILVVPCCIPTFKRWERVADELGVKSAALRRPLIDSLIGSERTLRLEAAGYATDIVPFVRPTVTPHNLLWRARKLGDPTRAAAAAARLAELERR